MIRVNELRFGNLVSDTHASNTFSAKVNKITSDRVYYGSFHSHPNDLIPIPITEEWLFKLGFEAINFLNGYLVQEKGYKYMDMIIRYGCFDGHRFLFDFSNEKCVNLKYVHQLQNIYFALTNKELELIK